MGGRAVENKDRGKGEVRATCQELTAMAGCLQVLPPQCWLTEAFLDAGDCSSPEVAARLLGLLRFWIQSWLRICAGLGLAGLSGTAEKHILKVAEKVLGCHHLICCQAKRPARDRRANSIGFGFLCCHFFSQQTDLSQAWIYVKQKPQQSNSHKCLRTLCTTLSA